MQSATINRTNVWGTILLFGSAQFIVYGVGAMLVEKFSGSCMFVIPAYFYTMLTILPILKLKRFGVGAAIFLPIATLGALMEYFMEWVSSPVLLGPWYALSWSAVFLGIGFSADLVYRFAPSAWHPRWKAIGMGVAVGAALYFLILLALTSFHPYAPNTGHLRFFQSGAYFTLPWQVINAAFAGYTAYALSQKI